VEKWAGGGARGRAEGKEERQGLFLVGKKKSDGYHLRNIGGGSYTRGGPIADLF